MLREVLATSLCYKIVVFSCVVRSRDAGSTKVDKTTVRTADCRAARGAGDKCFVCCSLTRCGQSNYDFIVLRVNLSPAPRAARQSAVLTVALSTLVRWCVADASGIDYEEIFGACKLGIYSHLLESIATWLLLLVQRARSEANNASPHHARSTWAMGATRIPCAELYMNTLYENVL